MKVEHFIKTNSNCWKELEDFSTIVNSKGIGGLNPKEIKRFIHLFRLSSHHLAYARTHYPNQDIVVYLNALVGKCHSHIYAVKKVSSRGIFSYLTHGFPQALKKERLLILSSLGVFTFGFILSLLMVLYNSAYASLFLPQQIIDVISAGEMGGGAWNYPLMSSYIMINNISVSLRAFVWGIALGIGTIYILFVNGGLLGALTALVYLHGNPLQYWSLILPHGIIELTAIFISGGAGLMLAKGLLLPGQHSRIQSVIKAAKNSVSLIMGVVIMLIIAGIIEGFFTPLPISAAIKLLFAAVTGLLLVVYILKPHISKN